MPPRSPGDLPAPLSRPADRPDGAGAPAGSAPPTAARRRPPVVTYALIGLCVAVFAAGPLSGLAPFHTHGTRHARLCAQAVYLAHWGVIPTELWHGVLPPGALRLPAGCGPPAHLSKVPALSVLTALFVHGGWLHLLGNLLFLQVFGAGVEERLGRLPFALFYLAGGYVATYGFALGHPGSVRTLVGASGAIAAVLGAYLFLHPRARVTGLLPFPLPLPLRLPAWLVLGSWFALQWLSTRVERTGPSVAYLAHLIGFSFGFLYAAVLHRRPSKLRPQTATRGDSKP